MMHFAVPISLQLKSFLNKPINSTAYLSELVLCTLFIWVYISTYVDKGTVKVPILAEIGVCAQGPTSKIWNQAQTNGDQSFIGTTIGIIIIKYLPQEITRLTRVCPPDTHHNTPQSNNDSNTLSDISSISSSYDEPQITVRTTLEACLQF